MHKKKDQKTKTRNRYDATDGRRQSERNSDVSHKIIYNIIHNIILNNNLNYIIYKTYYSCIQRSTALSASP